MFASPKKSNAKKIFAIVSVVVLLLIVIAFVGLKKPSEKTATPETKSSNVSSDKPTEKIIVPVKNLISDYKDNEVAADEKYRGKLLDVSGVIYGITNGITDDEMIINIGTGEEYAFDYAYCYVKPSEKDKVLSLKKGDAVSMEGLGDNSTIGSPVIKDCVIK